MYTNTNIYIYCQLTHIPKIGHSPNSVPEGHKETLQITFIPQVLAWYIQYKDIYSTDTKSQNVHSPNPVPEGHKETPQITFIPQVLACYIQYKDIYSTDT